MLRILLAVAALFVATAFTSHARAAEPTCVSAEKFIAFRPPNFESSVVMVGPEVARAVEFYNAMPGDDLGYQADAIVVLRFSTGEARIAYVKAGIICAAFRVPKGKVSDVLRFIAGDPA